MIGNCEGKTEISFDLVEWLSPSDLRMRFRTVLDRTHCQRSSSVARHPFAGTVKPRPRRLSESKPADLKTDDRVYWESELPCTVPTNVRTGWWTADRTNPK